jgi:hypothetical protein
VEQPICYLNTDLELESEHDLKNLADAFTANGAFALHVTLGKDGIWYAWIETNESYSDLESNIDALLSILESFPPSLRADWDQCRLREFNTGYDCGTEPWAFNQGWSFDLLARVVKAGASLRITLYPPTTNAKEIHLPNSSE